MVVSLLDHPRGDPLGGPLLGQLGFELGEDAEHPKESVLERIVIFGLHYQALFDQDQLGADLGPALGRPIEIADRAGDPLQVWKWPERLCIGVWNYFGASGPAPEGYAVGAMVGTAIAFVIGTVVARKLGIA